MKRTTISLPDELAAAVEREARRRGTSVSEIVRQAIETRLGRTEGVRKLPFIALGRSGQHDTASNIDEILKAEWTVERDRDS